MSHIAMVIPTLDRFGGAERQVMLLARGLRSRGWRVTAIALAGSGGDAAGELADAGVDLLSLEMRKGLADPRGWLRLNRWLRRERPQILHAHLPHAAWMARWSRLAAPVRVQIDTIHTSATGSAGRRLGYRLSRWLPDRVTAVGEGVREAHITTRMVAANRCTVVANGVDTGVWRADPDARAAKRREIGLGGEFLWFAAGRLEPVKDYATMMRAIAQVPAGARLAIAGAGTLERELRSLAASLGLAGRVEFLGFVPDVRAWMQAADGYVLSSRWEGLPMGLIEAAACALPAVATDVAGSREVIVEAETGWLVPAANPERLAEKMAAVMRCAAGERQAMSERARELAVARFGLARVLDTWEALYRELLDRNPKPRRSAG